MAKESPNASYSNFMIFTKTQTVLFEERQNIAINLFKKMFSAMYSQTFAEIDLSNMWIDPLVEKEQVLTKLRGFDKVTTIDLAVTPSNPDTGDWKTLDPLLKESKIARGDIRLNNEAGLNINGTFIKELLNLASMGHGNPKKIIGKRDGQEEIYIPSDEIKRLLVPYSENADTCAKTLCQIYITKLHGGGT